MDAYSVEQVRALEDAAIAEQGVDALMQRAAAAVAATGGEVLRGGQGAVYGARVLVLVGPGNNGGDALFAASRLARRGAAVTAVNCLGKPHAAGRDALLAAGGRLVALADHQLPAGSGYDLVVDGILGIGGRPGLTGQVADLATWLAGQPMPVVAVDLPSGVAADTGAVPGVAIRATHTVTFGQLKPCHLLEPARHHCGEITVVDIGLAQAPGGSGVPPGAEHCPGRPAAADRPGHRWSGSRLAVPRRGERQVRPGRRWGGHRL